MFDRAGLLQMSQIVVLRKLQAHRAQVELNAGFVEVEAAKASQNEAQRALVSSLEAWTTHMNAPAPDPMVLGFYGNSLTQCDAEYTRAAEHLEDKNSHVSALTQALQMRNGELSGSQKRLAQLQKEQRRHLDEVALTQSEDRISLNWSLG